MSNISSFFLAVFHFLVLAWSTIHPDVNPNRHQVDLSRVDRQVQAVDQVDQQVRVADRHDQNQAHLVYTSARSATTGYWHTAGSRILDDRGNTIRIQGINWYGFETVRKVPGGLVVQDYRAILDTIQRSGFNTVRIPLSNDMVEHPVVPRAIAFTGAAGVINQPLRGLDSLQILDRIVAYAGNIGLKVILDNHRSEAGDSAEASGLWYTATYPESSWIADWQMLARRYAGNATVVGIDLRNEPHNANSGGACWSGCEAARDWHLAAQRGGDAVLSINPRLIVFVEGTDAVGNDFYWWGGNLRGVRYAPVHLEVSSQLVYSAHAYGPNEYHQRWFDGATPASLQAVWDSHWGFISRESIAPVWVGEFGTSNRTEDITGSQATASTHGSQSQWFLSLVSFLGRNPNIGWASWALNGEDANGLLDSGYVAPANTLKLAVLNRLMRSPGPLPVSQPVDALQVAGAEVRARARQLATRRRDAEMAQVYRPHLPPSTLRFGSDSSNRQYREPQTLAPQPVRPVGAGGF